MRTSRYLFSEKLNPWMAGAAILTPWVREHRNRVSEDNLLLVREQELSKQASTWLDSHRKSRDEVAEAVFKWLYG